MLLLLLFGCTLFGPASCGLSPITPGAVITGESSPDTPAASDTTASVRPPTAAPQASVRPDPAIAGLAGLLRRASASDTTEESLTKMANVLAGLQTGMAAIYELQMKLLKVQNTMDSRLDVIEQQQAKANDRLYSLEVALIGLESTGRQLDGVSSRLDGVEKAQRALDDRVEEATLQQRQQQKQRQQHCSDVSGSDTGSTPETGLDKTCRRSNCSIVQLAEAVCGTDGRCSCPDGYRQVSGTTCRKHSRMFEPCLEDSDCQTLVPHGVCNNNTCDCPGGFWNNVEECRPAGVMGLGEACVDNQDCSSGVLDVFAICLDGKCRCPIVTMSDRKWKHQDCRMCGIGWINGCASAR